MNYHRSVFPDVVVRENLLNRTPFRAVILEVRRVRKQPPAMRKYFLMLGSWGNAAVRFKLYSQVGTIQQ
jgi:hypothetical protein